MNAGDLSRPRWYKQKPAAILALLYLALGAAWLLLADRHWLLLNLTPERAEQIQAVKALIYIVVTAILAYVFLDRLMQRQREATQALTASEAKYRELVQHANSIIMRWNHDGEITFLNEYGLDFFGYREEEIVGRHVVGTIVPETESTGRDLRPLMDKICADPKAYELNVNENVRRNGEKVWVSWTNKVSFNAAGKVDGILSIGTDITQSRAAELALRESESRYRGLFEDCPASLWEEDFSGVKTLIEAWAASGVTDFDAYFDAHPEALIACANAVRILDVNRATLDLLQYEHRDDLRRPLGTILHADTLDLFKRELLALWSGRHMYKAEAINHNRFGEEIYVNMTVALVPGHEATWSRVFVALTDITERVRAGEALERLNEELELRVEERTAELALAKDRAESADRLKSAFLASMSHELRTPLNSILGFTGLVLEEMAGPLNPEQAKQLGMVQNSARHLLDLINDVLDLSKIEAGQMEITREPFDPADSIDAVVHSLRPLAAKKGLTLEAEMPASMPALNNDRRRFHQVLINLVNNGIKFTNEGGVRVVCNTQDGCLTVRVIDTGIGIKPEDLDKLFKSFQQIDTGLSRNHEGTGLGLSICRKLATLMGGDVTVQSEWGAGSTFTFAVPASAAQPSAEVPA